MVAPKTANSQKNFFVNAEVCTGCGLCELACSVFKEGESNPNKSRIRIERRMFDGLMISRLCRNCRDPACMKVCHRRAIELDSVTGWVTINDERCNNCTLCIPACPHHALSISPEGNVLMCDLCGGEPKCVEFCATGAVQFLDRREGSQRIPE